MDIPAFKLAPDFQERAREYLARIEKEAQERVRERREGRKLGRLTHSLRESLRNCTPKQLDLVIKLARKYKRDYKEPPDVQDIQIRRSTVLIDSQPYKNRLYTLEMRSCGKPNCTKCPHGPYPYSYQRDGSLFPAKFINDAKFSRLPAEIRERFTKIRNEVRAEREKFFSSDGS